MEREGGGSRNGLSRGAFRHTNPSLSGGETFTSSLLWPSITPVIQSSHNHFRYFYHNVSTLKRALILGDYNVNPTSRYSRKRYGSKLFIGGFYSNKMMVFSPVQYLNLNIPLDFPGPFPVYKDKVPACCEGKGDGLHWRGQHNWVNKY